MAVGATWASPGRAYRAGLVRLYNKDGTDWNNFQQINGIQSNDWFGISLDLSHDGSALVVGDYYRAVYIYDFNNVTSVYDLFHTITGVRAREVCVSGDGSTIGFGIWNNLGAMIFVRNGDGFEQRGPTFTGGYGEGDSGIALNYGGTIAALGQYYWDDNRGRVGVFQWRDGNGNGSMQWMQMGSDITGDNVNDFLGYGNCVSITHNGLTVAVGAFGHDKDGKTDRGLVRVYNHDSTSDTWKQSGSDLVGDNAGNQLSKIALSSNGKYLTAGAWGRTGNYVEIFENIGNNYKMIGDKVTPEVGVSFGWSVDMSADGAAIAIGDNNFDNRKGRAYLFVRNDLTHAPPPSGNGNGGMYLFIIKII